MSSRKQTQRATRVRRGWLTSTGLSAAVVAIGVVASATVNPMLGRSVHWDWMALVAPTLLVVLVIALRRRWV